MMQAYDIFISYRTNYGSWVETLAQNLNAQGYSVFFDKWELVAGQSFVPQLQGALQNSRCGILVATPDASDSGWVQMEYEQMIAQKNSGLGFFFIPVIMGRFPDLPFLDKVQAVDFGDESAAGYRRAFGQLLCGVKQQPPGPNCAFEGALTLPRCTGNMKRALVTEEKSFVKTVFDRMNSGLPQMVLAQENTNTQFYGNALRHEAEQVYGAKNVLQIYPPISEKADSRAYFSRLSRQCGFAPAEESWSWAGALDERLCDNEDLFLLVSGFENGPDEPRKELAGELRQLQSVHPNFHLVMMGGERLAALKYANGSMSLLNTARDLPIPEPNAADMSAVYKELCDDASLSDEQLTDMMTVTGGHPKLLHYCLEHHVRDAAACEALLSSSHLPGELFMRFKGSDQKEQLQDLLQQDVLGPFDLWPSDELVRSLYWHNLITNRGGALCWRSEFIRQAGMAVVK
jgi:hypothetical protein